MHQREPFYGARLCLCGTRKGRAVLCENPTWRPCMNPNYLDEISERIRQLFAQSPAADLEKNLRALLASFFARLDLVTREEFDVQRQVLLRTREKLERLEAQVAELERKLGVSGPAADEQPSIPETP